MKTTPYLIRLGQLLKDMPDYADAIRSAYAEGDRADSEEARVELAQAAALALHSDPLTHEELNDPTMGVAATQKALQDLINRGFQTIYSTEAFAIHALDVRLDQEHISENDVPKYTSGELDPTDQIEAVIAEFSFRPFTLSSGETYYLSPHF